MKGAKMCKEGLQLKQISPHLTQKTTQNLMVVVVLSIMIPKLPSPSPDVASTNAKRQARPLAHADAAKPKKRSSRCVSGSVQCKWSTWKRLTKSDGPMLMDWWTLPVAMHWHAPMLRTLLSSTSHQEEKDWRVGRKKRATQLSLSIQKWEMPLYKLMLHP